jgi:hypothetical protein
VRGPLGEKARQKVARANVRDKGKPVLCVDLGIEYESESEAARKIGVSVMSISKVCNGHLFSVRGHTLRFISTAR